MLMPAEGRSVGRAIRQRCESYARRPDVFAEFDDSALMKTFGQDGLGLFPILRSSRRKLTSSTACTSSVAPMRFGRGSMRSCQSGG